MKIQLSHSLTDHFVNINKTIVMLKGAMKEIDMVDSEIDQRVYALYGLSGDEIRLRKGLKNE